MLVIFTFIVVAKAAEGVHFVVRHFDRERRVCFSSDVRMTDEHVPSGRHGGARARTGDDRRGAFYSDTSCILEHQNTKEQPKDDATAHIINKKVQFDETFQLLPTTSMTKVKQIDRESMEISFGSADATFKLFGDLTIPTQQQQQKVPAILIIAGSGPIDRNGNVPSLHMKLNTSNRFAEHMTIRPTSKSIAVLSYDKRGVGKSKKKGDKNLFHRAGMWDLVSDAVQAVRYLSQHPKIDKKRIVLLGHSEGAIILPLVCRQVVEAGMEPIHGCIFYAGFGENLMDAMEMQRTKILEEVENEKGCKGWLLRAVITKEKLDKQYSDMIMKVKSEDEPDFVSSHCGLIKQPAKWFREHMGYDASGALIKYITCHCLAITGRKDMQVRNEYCRQGIATELAPNAVSIEAHRPENLTHALRSLKGEAKILNIKKDYSKMSKMPLDAELLGITDEWCDRILFDV